MNQRRCGRSAGKKEREREKGCLLVLAGCRSDTLICLELLLYSDCETSWSWNSGRGDGSWHSGYADWKNVSSRPNQMRLWMCTTCGHHNSSKAACSQCGVRSSWAEVVKGVQQTNSATPPSLPNEEIKALEAALAAPPDNVDLCGKVRAPLEERLQHARKKRRETANPWINVSKDVEAPFNALPRQSRLRLHSNKQHKSRSKKPKRTNLVFEKNELEKQALSQTAQPTCLQTTSCKAAPLSAAVTELSRHMPPSEASAIQIALDGLLSLIAQAAERASRAEAEGTATRAWDCDDEDLDMDTPDDVLLETPKRGTENDAQEMFRVVRHRIRSKIGAEVPVGGLADDADDCRVGKHSYAGPQG